MSGGRVWVTYLCLCEPIRVGGVAGARLTEMGINHGGICRRGLRIRTIIPRS
jgi:hypothetical protein